MMIRPGLKIIFFFGPSRNTKAWLFFVCRSIYHFDGRWTFFWSTWQINQETRRAFNNSANGLDAVLGARGSKLQIIEFTLSLGGISGKSSWEQYELIKNTSESEGHSQLQLATIITVTDLWEQSQKCFLSTNGSSLNNVKSGGRIFSALAKEALVGAFVAKKLGLNIGDKFHPYHGLDFKEENKHQDIYVVVGVLESTGTPADRVIWVPIKGIQLMEGHVINPWLKPLVPSS